MLENAFTTLMTKEEGYIPSTMKASFKPKKVHAICKYFAHNIMCPYMKTNEDCRHIHCPYVRQAAQYAKEQRTKNLIVQGQTIKEILKQDFTENTKNPTNLLEFRRRLYDKYPKPPNNKELTFAMQILMKDKLDETCAQYYENAQQF